MEDNKVSVLEELVIIVKDISIVIMANLMQTIVSHVFDLDWWPAKGVGHLLDIGLAMNIMRSTRPFRFLPLRYKIM